MNLFIYRYDTTAAVYCCNINKNPAGAVNKKTQNDRPHAACGDSCIAYPAVSYHSFTSAKKGPLPLSARAALAHCDGLFAREQDALGGESTRSPEQQYLQNDQEGASDRVQAARHLGLQRPRQGRPPPPPQQRCVGRICFVPSRSECSGHLEGLIILGILSSTCAHSLLLSYTYNTSPTCITTQSSTVLVLISECLVFAAILRVQGCRPRCGALLQ